MMTWVSMEGDEETRALFWPCEDTVRRWLSTSQELDPH